ncbi:MAG: 50S ribosomal protein L25 [Candidatus Omnitrophota bacterium]
MEQIILEASTRLEIGKAKIKGIRLQGFIPGVVYKDGKESLPIKIASKELFRIIHEQHHLENLVLSLNIQGDLKKKPRACIIKEIQHDPVHGNITHMDFNEISLTKAIKVDVSVVGKGESIGVKQEGGSLEQILWEINVECLPTNIPEKIEVDITNLKMGDSIHLKDVTLPKEIKLLTDPEMVVFSVVAPMKEEVLEAVEGEEKQEPEVIKEKKEVPGEGKEEGKESKETKDAKQK